MPSSSSVIPGYRTTFTIVGIVYTMMACSMLVHGVDRLCDFGVSKELVAEPVLEDIFMFFYQLMAFVGVLIVVLGHVVRERKLQGFVGLVLCVANILTALRDLSTSDSALGNRLYKGEDTIVFVLIGATLAAIFGYFAWQGLRPRRTNSP